MTWQLLLTVGLLAADPALAAAPGNAVDRHPNVPALVRAADTSFSIRAWKSAATKYETLVEQNPTVGLYWYRLGESLRQTRRPEEAISPLEQAEQLGAFQHAPPRSVHRGEAAYSLAAAHAALGHKVEAIDWTRKSLAQGLRNIGRFQAEEFAELLTDPDFRELVWAVDVQELSRDDGFRLDVRFAVHELKRVHFSPFRATSEQEIDALVAKLQAEIPDLTDDQIFVRMMAIIRLFGDAHTRMQREQTRLPVSFFLFPEGLHITGATSEHADLVGAKVLKIAGKPAEEALTAAEALVARENPMTPRWLAPAVLRWATVLSGLGWAAHDGPISIEVEDVTGKSRTVELPLLGKQPVTFINQVPGCDHPMPLCLRQVDKLMWHEVLPDGKTMYCQLNGIGNARVPFGRYFERLFQEVEESEVEQLVLDLRWNGGGNTFLNPPLINGIIRSEKLSQPGKLFVVMGRNTFSAALNTLDELEQRTSAILVGEPTSSPPNFVGETIEVVLPYSNWPISISDLSWQTSFPMDYRVWVSPTLYAPPTAASFRAHHDPALEAILEFIAARSQPAEND